MIGNVFRSLIVIMYTIGTSPFMSPIEAQSSLAIQDNGATSMEFDWIQKTIDSYVERVRVPSLAMSLIKEGKLIAFAQSGNLSLESDLPVDENTIFQIGSLSKSFTGIICNNLIADGTLGLDDKVVDFLPEKISAAVRKKLSVISIRELLHHASGLPRDAKYVQMTKKDRAMTGGYNESTLLKELEEATINPETRGRATYSNLGYTLLCYVIQKAAGKTYEELLQLHIAQKYGLSNTTTELTAIQKKNLATPYQPSNRKKPTRAWEMGLMRAAGGIFSTISDLTKLMLQQMKDYENYRIKGEDSPLILTKYTMEQGSPTYHYGFGSIAARFNRDTTLTLLGHNGSMRGFSSAYIYTAQPKTGVIMLTSSGGSWFGELEQQIQLPLYDLPIPNEISLRRSIMKRYVGKYEFEKEGILQIKIHDDQLWAITPRGSHFPMYAETGKTFYYKAFPATFEFILDEKQEVRQLIYRQNGKTFMPKVLGK